MLTLRRRGCLALWPPLRQMANPQRGKTTNRRAGCGRTACPVRREGGPKPISSSYPYRGFPEQEMRTTIRIILLALFIPASVFAQSQKLKSPSEIAREQSKAVVIIEALDDRGSVTGQGSGFIVTSKGAVVTNLHVVQGASSLRVKLPGGDAYKTSDLVDVDDAKDIVVVKVKGFRLPVVTLGDSDKAET